jgi:H+/Cl- antiporter ClcA
MIHVGAAAGRQAMRLFPPAFGGSPVAARTMVAVGAGAGVAAAFKAPFAGVMFVVEELASSMMSLQMVTCALVANTCAFFVAFWLEKAQADGPVKYEFQVRRDRSVHTPPRPAVGFVIIAVRANDVRLIHALLK